MTLQIISSFKDKYDFLSNFYLHPVRWQGVEYPSNEHAFQAAKTLDLKVRERIRNAGTPGRAKKLGGPLAKGGIVILRNGWENSRLFVMLTLVRRKFEDPHLADLLLATGDAELVEGNWWGDTFWGVCGKAGGKNHLGKILMQVRDEIRRERNENHARIR